MKLTKRGSTFVFTCDFENRLIPKLAKFYFDPDSRVWKTDKIGNAMRLRMYADSATEEFLNSKLLKIKPWARGISIPKDQELMPHQVEAVKFALERNRSYLGLDPGLGKTPTAAVISRTLKATAYYVCPPFLVANVLNEFETWDAPTPVIIKDSVLKKEIARIEILLERDKKFGRKNLLIVDEAHRFKNLESKRTEYLYEQIVPLFDKVILMSGTPMPNRPMELFAPLSYLAHETIDFMSKEDYGTFYCAGFQNNYGWDFTGCSNLKLLKSKIKGTFMLRMRKELLALPAKTEEIVVINSAMPASYEKFSRQILDVLSAEDLMKGQIALELETDSEKLHIATYRKHLGLHKVPAVAEFVRDIVDCGESVIVFAIHKNTIAELARELYNLEPMIVTGDTPPSERQDIVDGFRLSAKKSPSVLIGNIDALGIGFNITEASRVVFAEFSWVPGQNDQAQDRAHRYGQTNPVHVQYLVHNNSVDKAVITALLKKRAITAHI